MKTFTHLAIPYTSGICVGTMDAANYKACDSNRERFCVVDKLSNTIAGNCFNELLCRCLTNVELPEGESFTYWCLLHSDVVPLQQWWLDILIDELETHGATVIHSPCCIKDLRGITSTAVSDMNDEWGANRKLTLHELHSSPETFGLADVLKLWEAEEPGSVAAFGTGTSVCLSPNTGCMVVKMGDWVRSFPGFEQRSRIVHEKLEDGSWKSHAEVAPEDWRFGRWCALNGLKVVGTRKVTTAHMGMVPWGTDQSWGQQKRDEIFINVVKGINDERNLAGTTERAYA